MRDDLFSLLESMTERVRADSATLDVDADDYLAAVWADVDAFGKRIGLTGSTSPPPADPPGRPPPTRKTIVSMSLPECFGCLLILICGRRLLPA